MSSVSLDDLLSLGLTEKEIYIYNKINNYLIFIMVLIIFIIELHILFI